VEDSEETAPADLALRLCRLQQASVVRMAKEVAEAALAMPQVRFSALPKSYHLHPAWAEGKPSPAAAVATREPAPAVR